jgi:hypothetical protein
MNWPLPLAIPVVLRDSLLRFDANRNSAVDSTGWAGRAFHAKPALPNAHVNVHDIDVLPSAPPACAKAGGSRGEAIHSGRR